MDKTVAAHLARSLMDKHGLGRVPFEFDRAKRRMGICYHVRTNGVYITTKIALSAYWTEARSPAEVENTILHEIAHALTPGHGHNHVWRAKARELGIAPNRCSAPSVEAREKMQTIAPAPWTGTCNNGHNHTMHRKPGRVQLCALCKGVPTPKRVIAWALNGRPVGRNEFGPKYQRDMLMVDKM